MLDRCSRQDRGDHGVEHVHGHEGLRPAVLELDLELVRLVEGIGSNGNGPQPQGPVIGDDHLRDVGEHERDPISLFDPETGESVGEPVRKSIKLCIGYFPPVKDERGVIRVFRGGLTKYVPQRQVRVGQAFGHIPLIEFHPRTVGGSQAGFHGKPPFPIEGANGTSHRRPMKT